MVNITTIHQSCPSCGAEPVFDPTKQALRCPYCGTITEIASNDANEHDIDQLFANSQVWNQTEVIKCENCGAKENLTKGQIAKQCPFCGTTNVVTTSEFVGMTPNGICPFQLTKSEASSIAHNWSKKKLFAPNQFKKSARANGISGIYVPVFTFDCNTETLYRGILGEDETRKNFDGEEEEYTSYYHISGVHPSKHNDIIINASENISSETMHSLGSYPTDNAVTFDEKYLAGYHANTYSKTGEQAWQECKQIIDKKIKREILNKYTYDEVKEFNANTKYNNRTFKYLLLPLFIGHYKFKKKVYNFYINGTSGKISGSTPISWVKILLTVIGGFVALGALFALFS